MEELEIFDRYSQGHMSEQERADFEQRLAGDDVLRKRAEAHFQMLSAMKAHAGRTAMKHTLDAIHHEMNMTTTPMPSWRKYSSYAAVAAVTALIVSSVAFLLIRTQYSQEAEYLELRKNVEQLKKSQTQILKDIKLNTSPPAGKYSGSGFLVTANGYVLTSYHVVKKYDSIFVENEKWGRMKATLVSSDPAIDLAILKIKEDKKFAAPPFSLRSTPCGLGEEVYTLGYPRADIVYGDGTVSANSRHDGDENFYQVSIPVNPGNSGSPMIDSKGAVIGMINGVQPSVRSATFAVKSHLLLAKLKAMRSDTLSSPLTLPRGNQLAGLPRVEQVRRWKDFVFVVKVY